MSDNITATIFDIQKNSFIDGPGIRTTVFFKGCNMKCRWCHNPESQKASAEMLIWKKRCVACGRCRDICRHELNSCDMCGGCTVYCPAHAREISGKTYTVAEVLKEVAADKIFYDFSGGGVTFSGGECMLQIEFLEKALNECHKLYINTAVDTAGNVPWEYFERIIPYTNMFLYDLKCVTEQRHIEGTGVSNKRILDNLKRLSESFDGDVIIRVPIIPTFNDDKEELEKMADFLKGMDYKDIDVLPYHVMGNSKYEALGRESIVYPIPSEDQIEEIKKILKNK